MPVTAKQIYEKAKGGIRTCAVSFDNELDTDELFASGAFAAEITSSDLTIDNIQIGSAAKVINGVSVGASRWIAFRVSGGTAGTTYSIRVGGVTDASPAQTPTIIVRIKVVADGT